jgi:hypothetical protein
MGIMLFSSFSALMLIFLATLLTTLSSILRSRAALELENLALRHQIGVLQRSARKRPKLILLDRLFWASGRNENPGDSSRPLSRFFLLS